MITCSKRRRLDTHCMAVLDLSSFAENGSPIHGSVARSKVGIPVTGVVSQVKGRHVWGHYIEKIVGPLRPAGHEGVSGVEAEAKIRAGKLGDHALKVLGLRAETTAAFSGGQVLDRHGEVEPGRQR